MALRFSVKLILTISTTDGNLFISILIISVSCNFNCSCIYCNRSIQCCIDSKIADTSALYIFNKIVNLLIFIQVVNLTISLKLGSEEMFKVLSIN
jgi:hypothetical protein